MAHAFLQSFDQTLEILAAETVPAKQVNQKAVKIMAEASIDISSHYPKVVDQHLKDEWDYLLTVCGDANETCPSFLGKVKNESTRGTSPRAA